MKSSDRPQARFLLAGAVNTAIGYGIYLLLLNVFDYRTAYALSYAAGIGISFVLNSCFVFRQPIRWVRLTTYPLVYVAQFLIGLSSVWVFVEVLGWREELAPVAAILLGVPVTYYLSRLLLTDE
jgi:putative flippase GtrA